MEASKENGRLPVRNAARSDALQTRDLWQWIPALRSNTSYCSASGMTKEEFK